MKNGRDILERAQAEANVAMLKKYFTLLFKKKIHVALNKRRRLLTRLNIGIRTIYICIIRVKNHIS